VRIRASFSACSGARVAAIPVPTSLAISSGVSIVASCALVGSSVSGGGFPAGGPGRYWLSSLSSLGGGEGDGDAAGLLDLGGEPPHLPPVPPAVGSGGSGGSGRLDTGIAGRRSLLVGGAGVSRTGLQSAERTRRGGGVAGADTALVLVGLTGPHQVCKGSGDGSLVVGDPGRGIRVAIHQISSLACRSSLSILLTFLWWSAAHNSTLPWKVTRCWLRAVLASASKTRASFTRVSWVAWHICRWLSSLVRSRMACQTFYARVW